MKTTAIIISTLLAFTVNCYAQITTITPQKVEKVEEVLKYDSLESLNYENAPLHLGQTLFLKGDSYSKENGFYYTFFSKLVPDSVVNGELYTYKPIKRANNSIYREETITVSDYSAIAGKYYKIISVESEIPKVGKIIRWLRLAGDNDSAFYFKFDDNSYCKDFVTLGYYEKMKKTFVGKEFYSKGRYNIENIDTKEKVVLPFKVKFKCTDIAVNVGEDGPIFAVLENEKYGRMKGDIIKGVKLDHFIDVTRYNEFVKKYGAKFGSFVAEGRIEIGMNKKMVLDAWGSPKDVNTTTGSFGVHEQWVYDDRYLYFKNGVLTSTQL